MPFTLAHPAAAVPLYQKLGRFGVLSALVIGSLAPDARYFLPFQISHEETHSFGGLFWFCLPAGFFLYLAFHLLLKLPMFSLLPDWLAARLVPFVSSSLLLPQVPWTGVVVSLFAGAVTHVAWDSLTHGNAFGIDQLCLQQFTLFTLGIFPFDLFRAIQYANSAFGMVLLTFWFARWSRSARAHEVNIPALIPARRRAGIILTLFFLPELSTLLFEIRVSGISGILSVLDKAVTEAMLAMTFLLFVYSITWHVLRFQFKREIFK